MAMTHDMEVNDMDTIAIADSYEFKPRQIVRGAHDGERYEVLMMWGTDGRFTYAVSLDSDTRITNPDFKIVLPE
jgi:hypothetical protein